MRYQALRDVALAVAVLASSGAQADTGWRKKAAQPAQPAPQQSAMPDPMTQMFLPSDVVKSAVGPQVSWAYEQLRTEVGQLSPAQQKDIYTEAQTGTYDPNSTDAIKQLATAVMQANMMVGVAACEKGGMKVAPGYEGTRPATDPNAKPTAGQEAKQDAAVAGVADLTQKFWDKTNTVIAIEPTRAPCDPTGAIFFQNRLDPVTGKTHNVLNLPATSVEQRYQMLRQFADGIKATGGISTVNNACVNPNVNYVQTGKVADKGLAEGFRQGTGQVKTLPYCFKPQGPK